MARSLTLKVLTPMGPIVEESVTEMTAPGIGGEFGVLPSHTPFLSALSEGILAYSFNGRKMNMVVRGGLAEIKDDGVVILTEEAYLPEDIDLTELQAKEGKLKASLEGVIDLGESTTAILDELAFIALLRSITATK